MSYENDCCGSGDTHPEFVVVAIEGFKRVEHWGADGTIVVEHVPTTEHERLYRCRDCGAMWSLEASRFPTVPHHKPRKIEEVT